MSFVSPPPPPPRATPQPPDLARSRRSGSWEDAAEGAINR
eukprot:COSAG02_NODE_400_length_23094_cov_309.555990_23_plen_39_part_01